MGIDRVSWRDLQFVVEVVIIGPGIRGIDGECRATHIYFVRGSLKGVADVLDVVGEGGRNEDKERKEG